MQDDDEPEVSSEESSIEVPQVQQETELKEIGKVEKCST